MWCVSSLRRVFNLRAALFFWRKTSFGNEAFWKTMKRNNTRRGSIDPLCCDHDAAIAHLILSSSLAAKRRQEQRQKEEEENEIQRDEERDLIISIHTTSMISRFLFSWNVRI
jgi:hypothetical protein